MESRADTVHAHARSAADLSTIAAIEPGASVCPFMEIQEGGLRAFMTHSDCFSSVNDKVVDIGCGYGKILGEILKYCPCQGIGIEINSSIARIAEYKLRMYSGRAKVVTND